MTYAELIASTGRKLTQHGIGPRLTAIGDLCEAQGQPRLEYLIVKQDTGMPGFELGRARWLEEIERCRKFPWDIDC